LENGGESKMNEKEILGKLEENRREIIERLSILEDILVEIRNSIRD
jgi:hypothetical protein